MTPQATAPVAHTHEYRYAGRERLKYGEVLRASCACGWSKLTAIVEVPQKFVVNVGRNSPRYTSPSARKRRPAHQT